MRSGTVHVAAVVAARPCGVRSTTTDKAEAAHQRKYLFMARYLRLLRTVTLACACVATMGVASNSHAELDGVRVIVEGQPITYDDAILATVFALGGGAFGFVTLQKSPDQMPAGWRYLYYAGLNASGKPTVWTTIRAGQVHALPASDQQELKLESQAVILQTTIANSALHPSDGLQALDARAKGDKLKLVQLASDLLAAVPVMSKLVVAESAVNRRWIFATLRPGMPRVRVLTALRNRGFAPDAAKDGSVVVELEGAFQPGCYFHNNVTIAFDASDRLQRIDYSEPIPNCL